MECTAELTLQRDDLYGKAQSCVCVCGLISKASWDVTRGCVEIIRKSSDTDRKFIAGVMFALDELFQDIAGLEV